jgi:anti-sigma B factor antagonist
MLGDGYRPYLTATVHTGDGRVRVAVAGVIDLSTATLLRERLHEAIGRQPGRLAVDLAGVTFMDSSGVAELVRAHQLAAGRQVTLTVVNCEPMVSRVLQLTGVWPLLTGGHPGRQEWHPD